MHFDITAPKAFKSLQTATKTLAEKEKEDN